MKRFRLKTWMIESAVVFAILATVSILTGNRWVEWIGTFAVLFTFNHASVSNRLEEMEAERHKATGKAAVDCYKWSTRYFILKECLWFAYFILHQSYAALVGVILFLIYPFWRTWYRKRYPLNRSSKTDARL
jgi:hypothetical protein